MGRDAYGRVDDVIAQLAQIAKGRRLCARGALGLLMAAVGVAGGCVVPEARVGGPECRRVEAENQLRAIQFSAFVEATGLQGEQLILQVRPLSRRGAPMKSKDGDFQDHSGAVAASRTVAVMEPAWRSEGLKLTIPFWELALDAEDLPASAEFSVVNLDGRVLNRAVRPLPVTADDLAPSLPPSRAAARSRSEKGARSPATQPAAARPATRPAAREAQRPAKEKADIAKPAPTRPKAAPRPTTTAPTRSRRP